MRKAAALAILGLGLSGCSLHELNDGSVVDYARDDAPAEVAGKSLLNVVPWTLYGAASVMYVAASVSPEAVAAAVDWLQSR